MPGRLLKGLLAMSLLTSCSILQPRRWPDQSGQIVLTFDDGPAPQGPSVALLDVLRKRRVPAVFCYIGTNVEKAPEIVARAARDGHVIANHTYHHTPWSLLSEGYLREEMAATDRAEAKAIGQPGFTARFFRPPYGLVTPAVTGAAKEERKRIAYLTFFVNDANADERSAPPVMRQIKRELLKHHGGAIVLHEMRYTGKSSDAQLSKAWLPAAVDDLIGWARAQGMDFTVYEGSNGRSGAEQK